MLGAWAKAQWPVRRTSATFDAVPVAGPDVPRGRQPDARLGCGDCSVQRKQWKRSARMPAPRKRVWSCLRQFFARNELAGASCRVSSQAPFGAVLKHGGAGAGASSATACRCWQAAVPNAAFVALITASLGSDARSNLSSRRCRRIVSSRW